MIVYCDTNVFDCLEQRRGVTEWDVYRFQRAVKHGCIRVVLSFLNLEETLFLVKSQPKRAAARIKLILEVGDKSLFALSQEMIVNNDIHAYAQGTSRVSAFTVLEPGVEFEIRNFAKPLGGYVTELCGLEEEIRRDKEAFHAFLQMGKTKVEPYAKAIGGKQYPFEKYLANNSEWLAQGLAERVRMLKQVDDRGVDGLLKVKSVALAVGANLSLLYSHHFEGRAPESGDSRDILHAIVASGADVFVTEDRHLAHILARIPVDGLRIMSLCDLLKSLPSWV